MFDKMSMWKSVVYTIELYVMDLILNFFLCDIYNIHHFNHNLFPKFNLKYWFINVLFGMIDILIGDYDNLLIHIETSFRNMQIWLID
jgi:hypothetical protein